MDISERYSFRINMSEYSGSFWVDAFLESADENKVLLPDGLEGKRVTFKKVTLEGSEPKFNVTNYVIDKVAVKTAKVVKPTGLAVATAQPDTMAADPMALALDLAIGKTEAQFKSAASLHPALVGNPLLPLIKSGLASQALITDGKMVLGEDGTYQRVE